MLRAIMMAGTVLLVALSGCFGDRDEDDDRTSPDGTTTSPGGGEPTLVTVSLINFTETAAVGEDIGVAWRVEPSENTTIRITHTAVHWANFSVEDPETPDDYGNTSGEQVDAIPGDFETNFTVDQEDTIFLRAHANVEGQDYWSAEVEIEVAGNATNETGEIHEVDINGAAALADFSPGTTTIAVGDGVKWTNNDAVGTTHTATSDAGAPAAFDTGDIPDGETSDVIFFTEAGTYEYHCQYHPTSMQAQIVVEEA